MTLYEIDNEIRMLIDDMLNAVDENGEVIDIDATKLYELEAERDKKWESIACYIKNLRAEAAAIKTEVDNLTARKKSDENKADRLEELLAESMTIAEADKFSTARCKVSFGKSQAVIVPDIELLDADYVRTTVNKAADKAAIKEAIKNGVEVRGAYIEDRRNIKVK